MKSLILLTFGAILVCSMAASPADASMPGDSFAWGYNCCGEIGNGTTNPSAQPTPIAAPAGVRFVSVSAGSASALAIGSDGKLYAWGSNGFGQLGDGTHVDHHTPEAITLRPGVTPTAVSDGYGFALAIGSDGQLYAWGNNAASFSFAPPDGLFVDQPSPKILTLAPGVTPIAIAAGESFAFAIGSDGQLYGFGYNEYTLGDGTNVDHAVPEVISLAPGISPVAVSTAALSTMAIGSDGQLYVWGYNLYGQLGIGTTDAFVFTPRRISLAPGVTPKSIVEGAFDSYAIGSDNKLYDWGYNGDGELGLGNSGPTQRNLPGVMTLPGNASPASLAAGLGDAFAIGSDNNLYAWGYNYGGQVGNGTTQNVTSPVVVPLGLNVAPMIVAASTTTYDTVAVTEPGLRLGRFK